MCRTIYFADKILLFSSRPVGEPYHEIPLEAGTTLPQAKILNFLETFNFVAVVAPDPAVVNDRGERLMIYRNGRWDLPKGHWERGETIEACALREVREETGVAASIRRHLCDTLHCYQLRGEWEMKRTHWFEMAAAADATLRPQTEEGIDRVCWCTPAEVELHLQQTFPTIRRVFAKL